MNPARIPHREKFVHSSRFLDRTTRPCLRGSVSNMFSLISLSTLAAAQQLPTVSIIMPTNGRPEFVQHALKMIGKQDYPAHLIKEVIIIDDSPAPLRLTAPQAAVKIDYVVLSEQISVGAKRNLAASRASGDVIAHWDDDDFYGTQRLREQIAPIAAGKANITVLPHAFTYFMEDDTLKAVEHKKLCTDCGELGLTARASWGPHFGTLVFRASVHSARDSVTFPDTSEAEDYVFAQRAVEKASHRLVVVDIPFITTDVTPIFVCVRHSSNTWRWGNRVTDRFRRGYHARSRPSSIISTDDRTFAEWVRSEDLLSTIAQRRTDAAPVKRIKPPDLKQNFFDALYAGASSSDEVDASARNPNTTVSYFEWGPEHEWNKWIDCEKPACNQSDWKMTTYDLVSELIWDGGSVVGAKPTPLAAHGGQYTLNNGGDTHVLTAPLTVYYYTTLTIRGNLDCAGNAIQLGSFGELHVQGTILNAGRVYIGVFTNLTAGSAIGGNWALGGGGSCGIGHVDRTPCLTGTSTFSVADTFVPTAVVAVGESPPPGYMTGPSLAFLKLFAGEILGGGNIDFGSRSGDPIQLTISVNRSSYVGKLDLVKASQYTFGGNLTCDISSTPEYTWFRLDVGGTLSFGSATLYSCYDCITAKSLQGTSLTLGMMESGRAGSLSITGAVDIAEISLGMTSSLTTSSLTASRIDMGVASIIRTSTLNSNGFVSLAPSADLSFSGTASIHTLQIASWGRISSSVRTRRLMLAPHFYCNDAPAGDGDRLQNRSSQITCHWPTPTFDGDPWGSHNPEPSCRIDTPTCGSTMDIAVPWLVKYAAAGCFLGPDGNNVFGLYYNFSQPC